MRFYITLFFCFVFFFTACNNAEDVPDGIIPLHQMASLLTDIHIVDGSLSNQPQQPDTLARLGLGLYLAVFKLHHTDTLQFKKSLQYYAKRPDLLSSIYIGVTHRLSVKIDSLHKLDSIEKVKLNKKQKLMPGAAAPVTPGATVPAAVIPANHNQPLRPDPAKKMTFKAPAGVPVMSTKPKADTLKRNKLRKMKLKFKKRHAVSKK